MSAAFDRAHLRYEQNNGLVGMTKKAFLFFDSITIDLEKPTDPAVRKQSYSTKTHKNGLVSTGTCSLSFSLPSHSHKDKTLCCSFSQTEKMTVNPLTPTEHMMQEYVVILILSSLLLI